MAAATLCDPQLTVFRAVVHHSHSASLFTSQGPLRISEYGEEKRRKQFNEFTCTQR